MNKAILNTIDDLTPALDELFSVIAARTGNAAGISRDAYGANETAAAELLREFSLRQGLEAGYDHAGNLNVTAPGRYDESPEIIIGSHIDSVPHGGNFDGLAGIVGGIGVLMALKRHGADSRNVRVLGFRGEESPWFGTAYLGSKLFVGQLPGPELQNLRRTDTGKTLAEHMQDSGIDLDRLGDGPAVPLDRVSAYLELHIEQGPLLEAIGQPVGFATAIRGNIRYPFAKCFGSYAHSGAVPRHLRSDALMATAKLVAYADEPWRDYVAAGNDDLVFTCGIFHTDFAEHAMTKVPGEVTFSLNIGGTSNEVMEQMHAQLLQKADALAREHGVRFDLGKRVGTPAVALSAPLAGVIERAGRDIGVPPHAMPTVGHDAAIFARMGIPAGVILLRNANGSHNANEQMDMGDFALGMKVLVSTVIGMPGTGAVAAG